MRIVVYSKPECNACTCTKILLTKLGLPFQDIDITKDPDARRDATQLGYHCLPVVVISNSEGASQHWAGFRPDRIRALGKITA